MRHWCGCLYSIFNGIAEIAATCQWPVAPNRAILSRTGGTRIHPPRRLYRPGPNGHATLASKPAAGVRLRRGRCFARMTGL